MFITFGTQYLSASPDRFFLKERIPKEWETFIIEYNSDFSGKIRTVHNKWLCINNESLSMTSIRQEAQEFLIVEGKLKFKSNRGAIQYIGKDFDTFGEELRLKWLDFGVDRVLNMELGYIDDYVEQFSKDGYIIFDLLTASQINKLKEKLKTDHTNRESNLFELDEEFISVLENDKLLLFIRLFLGYDIKLSSWSSHTLVEAKRLHWHVDYPYHDMLQFLPFADIPMSVQVVIALDQFDDFNGATILQKKSHLNPRTNEKMKAFLKPGQVLLFHSALIHSAGVNTTGKSRSALLGNFTIPVIRPKDNIKEQFENLPKEIQDRHSRVTELF